MLAPGFADAVHDSQRGFRLMLDAMAHPGRIHDLARLLEAPPPPPLDEAAAVALLTLADIETPIWLDGGAANDATSAYLRFHCGAPIAAELGAASFAVVAESGDCPPLDGFALGRDAYPDGSTTLMLHVERLEEGSGTILSGPGIDGQARLTVAGPDARFWQQRRALQALFPRGLDIVFTCGSRLAALPRSTRVEG